MTTAIKTSLGLSAVAALLLSTACGADGNTGRNPPSDELVKQIPWLNGAVPFGDANGVLATAPVPVYPPVGLNRPDPGSAPVDACTAEAAYEFAPWVATMEPEQYAEEAGESEDWAGIGYAIRWAGADDWTRGSWRSPGFQNWYPGLAGKFSPSVWGTPAAAVGSAGFGPSFAPSCNKPNNNVLRMHGSGFRYYGGNYAHILSGDNYSTSNFCPPGSSLCPPVTEPGATKDSAGFPLAPTKNDVTGGTWQLRALHTYWDGSAYDGVSFWARRGPEGMGSLLVTINTKDTSDDLNRQNETYCRRIFACRTQCLNYQPCQPSTIGGDLTNDPINPQPVMRCYDFEAAAREGRSVPLPENSSDSMSAGGDMLDAIYPRCGNKCTFRTTYPDADFEGKDCRPYTFTSGESGEYCYDESEGAPATREERCGDGFTAYRQLSTDWKLYTVPFSEMRQGGYGKRARDFDRKSMYSITLGWGAGDVDFYIDNVTFYRTKKP